MAIKRIFAIALFILFLPYEVFCAEYFKIIQSDQSRIVIEIPPIEFSFEEIDIGGSRFHTVRNHNDLPFINQPGYPRVPIISVPIGIPFLSQLEVRVLESQFTDRSEIVLEPAPAISVEKQGEARELREVNEIIYSTNAFFPESPAEISQRQIFRFRQIAVVNLFPIQHNPRLKIVRLYTKLKVEILFHSNRDNEGISSAKSNDDPFDKNYQKLVVNYPVARNWTKPESKNTLLRQKVDWYNPDYNYYKLLICRDGLYRLTYDDLQNVRIPLPLLDPHTIKIFNRGQEIPVRVAGEENGIFESGDFVEFYGQRQYGESAFYDDYADTNVYWLTFGGDKGKRLQKKESAEGNFPELTQFRQKIHLEQDESYYSGDNSADIIDTEPVAGEGWIWQEFFEEEEKKIWMHLENVASENTSLCTLSVFLRGITLDAVKPDHDAQIKINNILIGDAKFDNLENYLYTTAFPCSVLKNGENFLTITSVATEAEINKFYFDWLELSYPASFVSINEKIEFSAPQSSSAKISLWNVKSDSFSIVNLSQNYFITNFSLKKEQQYILKLLSAGFDDGNDARIEINNQRIIDGGIRGHNIVVFDTTTGQVGELGFFDTLDKTENADSLAAFVARVPAGKLVLVAIRDEGSYRMTENAHRALESVGSGLTRQVSFRDAYVLLGRKGAAPGSVPELLVKAGQGQAILVDTLYATGATGKHLEFQDDFAAGDKIVITGTDSLKKPEAFVLDDFQNLKSTENGADYIFITHRKFQQIADKFSAFWEARNLRTKVVDIEEVYDEFNYGIKHARAVKDFLAYAFESWQKPAPVYVLLIGDASWDPKKNARSSLKTDYIPVWGNPVTDNWFVCFDGEDDILPEMFIGRLAIETADEGETVFRKVENYSALPSEDWKKHLLFINGGTNDSEQVTFGSQTQNIIADFVYPPPASCVGHVLSKELDGLYEGEKRDEILNEINQGRLWVNFIGHGGSGTWDLMFHDEQIFQLTNRERLPYITSFTCHTGRFANPEITNFGEKFVFYSEAGAIGFTGTSGWGFIYEDEVFADKLFETVFRDTVRQMGAALALAKLKFWAAMYPSVRTKSVIYQYSLLGDPAVELTLPKIPDLVINDQNIHWSPISPVEQDSIVEIRVKIENYGLQTADSVQLKITDNYETSGSATVFDQKIRPIGYRDSLEFALKISNQPGEHVLQFMVDPEDNIGEVDETNNQAGVALSVGSSRITISKPQPNQVVNETAPLLQVNNPFGASSSGSYFFELDTAADFAGDGLIQSGLVAEGRIVTRWQAPALEKNKIYYWRCRRLEENLESAWINAHFMVGDEFGWQQQSPLQFKVNECVGTEIANSGVQLVGQKILFHVESSGWDDLNYALIFINGTPAAAATRGHNIVVCDAYGQLLQFQNFDTHDSPQDVADMVYFLDQIPNGYFVLAGIMDSGVQAMSEEGYLALESIGSKLCRDVTFRDAWAIIGKKGAMPGSVPEKLVRRFNGVAIVDDTLKLFQPAGNMLTPPIGPANGWKNLSWQADSVSANSEINVDVFALNKNSFTWDTLFTGLHNQTGEMLSSIRATDYPYLKLKANFSSSSKFCSPILKKWLINFEPVADLAIDNQTVTFFADTLLEGATLKITADIYNVGYVTEDSVKVALSFKNRYDKRIKISETWLDKIQPNSSQAYAANWNFAGQIGVNQVFLMLDPEATINELSENNNQVIKNIVVLPDTIQPVIDVTYDDKVILQQDFVAPDPLILISVYDNSPANLQNDTLAIRLRLDGKQINYWNNEQTITLLPVDQATDTTLRAKARFTPHLTDGDHWLEIFAKDVGNNYSYRRDDFKVTSELKIFDVFNFPNPFTENTNFTFYLTRPADKITVKIFTTAGRLIQKIEQLENGAGYQQIFWDGRDRDGDVLANGVYLYKIIVTANGEQREKIEKLVIMK